MATPAEPTTTISSLPTEVMLKVFNYLDMPAAKSCTLVCKQWLRLIEESDCPLMFVIDCTNNRDTYPDALAILRDSNRKFRKMKLVDAKINLELASEAEAWQRFARHLTALQLSSGFVSHQFSTILSYCRSLKHIKLCDVFMDGKSNWSRILDAEAIEALRRLETFDLSCRRSFGLNDAFFVGVVGQCTKLKKLMLAGCRITFAAAIIRRSYFEKTDPEKMWANPTHYGFTFPVILHFIRHIATQLTFVDLSNTEVGIGDCEDLNKVRPGLVVKSNAMHVEPRRRPFEVMMEVIMQQDE